MEESWESPRHNHKYDNELKRLSKKWKKKGYLCEINDDTVHVSKKNGYTFYGMVFPETVMSPGRFTAEYKKLTKACKKAKYASIEKILKK